MINDKIQERTVELIGVNNIERFQKVKIAVIGLGGVGGTALMSLARSGFLNFYLVDSDYVEHSNLNRQILFSSSDIGLPKVEQATKYLLNLSKNIKVDSHFEKVSETNIENLLDGQKVDFIVDAIDDINGKLAIIKYSIERKIPAIISLGMGNRLDPHRVEITTLDKTNYDPLAKKLRAECRKNNLDLKEITAICSTEQPLKKNKSPSSMIMVPSSAGLLICYHVINHFLKEEKKEGLKND